MKKERETEYRAEKQKTENGKRKGEQSIREKGQEKKMEKWIREKGKPKA